MILLDDSLPLVRYGRQCVELDERWITESLFEAAAQTGRSRWWAEQVTGGLLLFFRHDVREQEVDHTFVEESVRLILQKLNAHDVLQHFHLLPPRAMICLETLAESLGPCPTELHFFELLRREMSERLERGVRSLHCCGLRPCVKHLLGTRDWRKNCESLSEEIIETISAQCLRRCRGNARLDIVVSS